MRIRRTPLVRRTDASGFTLLEVLVAVAIIAVALLASLRAAGLGSGNAEELRLRLLGGWVAENLLAEHRARGEWLPVGVQSGATRQGGIDFVWREDVSATPHPAMQRIDIVVAPANETRTVARLSGTLTQAPAR